MKTILIAISLIFGATQAFACICMKPEPIDSAYKHASTVFIGKAREIVKDKFFFDQGGEAQLVIFDIIQGLKNSKAGEGPITVVDQLTSCSFYFEEGKTYVVFAYSDYVGVHTTDMCTRTKLLEEFEKSDMQRLETISANYKSDYREIGVIKMLAPKYNDMIDKISQLEKEKAFFKILSIIIAAVLLISIGVNTYLMKK
jgi:hypothetical protein